MCYQNFCLLEKNVRDRVNATHVAITEDGLRHVVDEHKTQCRYGFQDQGLVSKTVPFRMITDASVAEPAGKSGPICCMVPNTLATLYVDTASSGGSGLDVHGRAVNLHELEIAGLVDPTALKNDIWGMVRHEGIEEGVSGVVTAAVAMDRGGGAVALSTVQRMEELHELKSKGYITDEEFEAKRKGILQGA